MHHRQFDYGLLGCGILGGMLGMLGMALSLGVGRAAAADTAATVIGTVGDTMLTTVDLDRAVRRRAGGRRPPPDQEQKITALAIEDLIDRAVLRDEIARSGVVVEQGEIDEHIAQITKQLSLRRIPLESIRESMGLDVDAFRQQMELEVAIPKLVGPQITPDVLRAVAQSHKRELDGTRLRVSHIIIRPDGGSSTDAVTGMLNRAEAIRTAILKGEISFADAAAQHSAGPSRRRGGDVGFVPRHGMLVEEFSKPVFTLGQGEISKPFVTSCGAHIATVTETEPGTGSVEQYLPQLQQIAIEKTLAGIVARLRKTVAVEIAPDLPRVEPAAAPPPTP